MKSLAIVAHPSLNGLEALLITLAGALLPTAAVLIWTVYFRKPGTRKVRRRRRVYPAANGAIARTNGAPATSNGERATAESRS